MTARLAGAVRCRHAGGGSAGATATTARRSSRTHSHRANVRPTSPATMRARNPFGPAPAPFVHAGVAASRRLSWWRPHGADPANRRGGVAPSGRLPRADRLVAHATSEPHHGRSGEATGARLRLQESGVHQQPPHVVRVLGSAATEGTPPFTFVKLEHVIQRPQPAIFANTTESVANVANVPEYVPDYVPNFIPRRVRPHPLVMRQSASCPAPTSIRWARGWIHSPRMPTHATCELEPK